MKALNIIIAPVITEKATKLSETQTYMFFVTPKATKIDVKQAIRELYGLEVATVRSISSPVKTKIMKRTLVDKRPAMKKVMITLKGKKKLDVTKFAKESKSR